MSMRVGWTHGGIYHTDDVVAAAILLLSGKVSSIRRGYNTGDHTEPGDILFDVGGAYSPDKGIFDHHQRNAPVRDNDPELPYSSAGLIWKNYGLDAIYAVNGEDDLRIWRAIDQQVILEVDLLDNGKGNRGAAKNVLQSIVSDTIPPSGDMEEVNAHFQVCVGFVKFWLKNLIKKTAAKLKDEETIIRLVAESKTFEGPLRKIILLERGGTWQEVLLREDVGEEILFVVFPDKLRGDFKVQAVPKVLGSTVYRKGFPEDLRGRPKHELAMIHTGLTFVHPAGFIASLDSLFAAIEFARKMV